ncbi:MAG TPA: hypothetical protein PKA28_12455 [Methylomusa anaerophila]|uniref:Uncharacterized protein n=1 Tax=Methylomusa anaerophila TaxID=1930071 RepID=A0A348AF65_9FIRM|nr:hypothetical protein [Methylomusa anaerophila]BBB89713.1 hypothetical protein MAMMFC1_00346 [Methylomusa anaerophila]HML89242.1 hypothetical protein [Methylomusa anaerophila]
MGLKDLEKLLKEKGENKGNNVEIDWEAEKNKWLNAVADFFHDIECWVGNLPNLKIDYTPITIKEEYIGHYETKKMIITMLNQNVTLEPIGTNLIGAHGRIDLKGKKGTVKFVLVPKKSQGPKVIVRISNEGEIPPLLPETEEAGNSELVWKIATPAPKVKFYDIDGDVFSDALMAVL